MDQFLSARTLIENLVDHGRFPHPVDDAACIETHISWVVLAGAYAYKFKKPLDLSFLDYRTLAHRREACEEELRLNTRTAPEVYVDVVHVGGTLDAPCIGGSGAAHEYAVRMRRFDQACVFSALLEANALTATIIDDAARHVAHFHESAAIARPHDGFGTAEAVCGPARQNFAQIREQVTDFDAARALRAVETWSEAQGEQLRATFARRLAEGHVRECHGDLHLGNLVLLDGRARLFDAIEFDPSLRWTDVVADIAFLVMDLDAHACPELAQRFLNAYLEHTGDYDGLYVLRYYAVYRAMVRAKVAAIRGAQGDAQASAHALAEVRRYLAVAQRFMIERRAYLFITHGVSGSGKTWHTGTLVTQRGAIRVRSDVERKRLFGLTAQASSGGDIYSEDATQRTYARLGALATLVLRAGYSAIADATFLERARRDAFRALARAEGVHCILLAFDAPAATLRERVRSRARTGRDASEADVAVLESQLARREALAADEMENAVVIDADTSVHEWLVQVDHLCGLPPATVAPLRESSAPGDGKMGPAAPPR